MLTQNNADMTVKTRLGIIVTSFLNRVFLLMPDLRALNTQYRLRMSVCVLRDNVMKKKMLNLTF